MFLWLFEMTQKKQETQRCKTLWYLLLYVKRLVFIQIWWSLFLCVSDEIIDYDDDDGVLCLTPLSVFL